MDICTPDEAGTVKKDMKIAAKSSRATTPCMCVLFFISKNIDIDLYICVYVYSYIYMYIDIDIYIYTYKT